MFRGVKNNSVVVLASTFPRWVNDNTPPFVEQFCQNIKNNYSNVFVLAPHSKGAKKKETKENISIKRFRYFYPVGLQNIAYEGGAVQKISSNPLYVLKLALFMVSMIFNTFIISMKKEVSMVNAHWIVPQGFIAILCSFITRKKVAITVHGGDIFSLNGKLMRLVKKFTLKHADLVVVNSSSTKEACEALYKREYPVVSMGINFEKFANADIEESNKNNKDSNTFTILFVGRVSEEKGLSYLVEALALLKKDKVKFRALIVGDGPEKEAIQENVNNLGLSNVVELTGWVDSENVPKYYAAADVFVGPSIVSKTGWKEAFGLVFAEALASSTPVIATKTGGIKDIVEDGKSGFLVEEKSSSAIYEKLKLMSKDDKLRTSMGSYGQKHIKNNFTWEAVSERYIKLFNDL